MSQHEKISYVEFPSCDLAATRAFFAAAFGWSFEDFGPDYIAFADQGIDGGFYAADMASSSAKGSALVVLYSADIHASQSSIEEAGGVIVRPIFDFPGGRRFHFTEPGGNELAVWSEAGG
jgi:predicted enzyme related to lactoylglutathione lyase